MAPMTSETDLTIIDQREVTFYGDELIAVLLDDKSIYVGLRHMCRALGLGYPGQLRRIRDHDILSEGLKGGINLITPSSSDRGGGSQASNVLRIDLVPLWLSGLRIKAVKEEIRPKLERYQREAAKVLWEAFQEGRLSADPTFADLLKQDTPEAAAYKMIQGMLQLARNQLLIRGEIEDHGRRLEAIEATLGDPGRNVTPEQASQLSQAVKAVAMKLSEQSGRNEYGGVYGELYRKFSVTGYKLLPAKRFQEAMDWLTEWYQSITDAAVPF